MRRDGSAARRLRIRLLLAGVPAPDISSRADMVSYAPSCFARPVSTRRSSKVKRNFPGSMARAGERLGDAIEAQVVDAFLRKGQAVDLTRAVAGKDVRCLVVVGESVFVGWDQWTPRPPVLRHDKAVVSVEERSEDHTSELQSRGHLVCRLLL